MSELKRYFMAGDDFEAIPDATGKWVRFDDAQSELAALREELADKDKEAEGLRRSLVDMIQRGNGAEQLNAELIALLRDVKQSDRDHQWMSYPTHRRIDAALKPTESGASDKCVSDGGTCGLGGQCTECPHKESGASE